MAQVRFFFKDDMVIYGVRSGRVGRNTWSSCVVAASRRKLVSLSLTETQRDNCVSVCNPEKDNRFVHPSVHSSASRDHVSRKTFGKGEMGCLLLL